MKTEYKYLGIIVAIFLIVVAILAFGNEKPESYFVGGENGNGLKSFSSVEELGEFIKEASESSISYYSGSGGIATGAAREEAANSIAPPKAAMDSAQGEDGDYSTTNVQIEGVDEPDIVKSDGEFLYVVSGQKIFIVKAVPADKMEIVEEMSFENYVNNIFVADGKLVVLMNEYKYFESGVPCVYDDFAYGKAEISSIRAPCGGYSREQTRVNVYDLEDKENPELTEEYYVSGNFFEARMTDGKVYLVTNKYIDLYNFEMPIYYADGVEEKIAAEEIYYFDSADGSYIFNIVSAINLENGEIDTETFLLGSSYATFFSDENIYFAMMKSLDRKNVLERYANEVVISSLPNSEAEKVKEILNSDEKDYIKEREVNEVVSDYADSIDGQERLEFFEKFSELSDEYYEKLSKETDRTVIHKINFDGMEIEYDTSGEVPGRVLNQFSMDEREGYLRIATTTGESWNGESENNLYVLDENLEIVGSVEGLAEGERIYSTRFLGDKLYMVTFRQVDPLYVIDLSDEENPKVLGFLKVTGYSSYLHPYDENHIIGIGKEATTEGRALGVKISLFDVSDFENPKEVGKYEIKEGMWSDSDALYDHKAFLFDKEKELLVVPISYSNYNSYWQGAYVFGINLEGIKLKGKVTHNLETEEKEYWYRGNDYVRRSAYIGDVLYTISERMVKASNLSDLKEIDSVSWSYEYSDYPVAY